MTLRYLSLFSGIGGMDLGFDRAGMVCAGQVEIDDYCRRVLAKHWPDVPRMNDVREVQGDEFGAVDLICGGFPCQPHSLAGNRKASEDERDLWGEFVRIIRATKPRWIVAENVFGLLSSENGRFFGGVLRDLAACGYDATWQVLRASDFGAIHQRERVFLVAHRDGQRIERFWEKAVPRFRTLSWGENVRRVEDLRERPDIPFPLVCRKDDGFPRRVDYVGNAVVPQIAQWIGERIVELDAAHLPEFVGADKPEVSEPVAVGAKNHPVIQGVFTTV